MEEFFQWKTAQQEEKPPAEEQAEPVAVAA
jgi:hypothetical protein